MKHTLRFSILFTLMMLGVGFLGMGGKSVNTRCLRRIRFALLFLCIFSVGFGQSYHPTKECGTREPTKGEMIEVLKQNQSLNSTKNLVGAITVYVKFHNVLNLDGTGRNVASSIYNILYYLNQKYASVNIIFKQSGSIDYIYSSNYYDFYHGCAGINDEGNLRSGRDVTNAINIYFVGTIRDEDCTPLTNGFVSDFPSVNNPKSSNAIFIRTVGNDWSSVIIQETIPHEMGHYFNLYHTHSQNGDSVSDTPYDPGDSRCVSSECTWICPNYNPDVRNLMSYYHGCRNRFTAGQYQRIEDYGKTYRTNVNPALSQRYYLDGINKTVLDYSGDNVLCAGKTITLSFGAYGDPSYYQGIFSIQLKPISGSNNYYNISSGINTTSGTGTITGTIPVNTPAGYYKLRIYKSTSLAIVDVEELMVYINGTTNGILTGSSISSTLYLTASSTYYNATSTCGGNSISLSSNLAGYDSYRWVKDGQYLTATSTSSNLEASTTGRYTLKMTKCGNLYTSPNSIALTFYNLSTPSLTASANGESSATVLNVCSGTPVLLSATCATNTYPVWGNGLYSNATSTSASVYANATTTESYTARCSNYFCISANSPPVRIVKEPSIQSIKTGDWQDAATWSCNCVPINCQDVSIEQGHTINIPINDAKAKNITIKGILNFQNNAPPISSKVSLGG